ncbi:hypothetical protein TCAL_05296 [Tigriopus californicus]|uniref:Tudor domain-containing protein 7 n=1 Tax=Tigriopus californicus TaxID=6832 RepID=A0A553P1R1_TIGCA|nr:hypothetical protein TCAL_05296 [Tigriopus californicus]
MTLSTEEREKKAKEVKSLIRSLLISSKHGVPLQQIQRDYREIIGTNIPFRDLGHATLEEFLDHAPDTCRVARTAQGYVLHGVATSETAHIAALVAKQAPKKRKNKPIMMPGRRPQSRGMWHPTPFVARGGGARGGRGGFRGVGGWVHPHQRLSTLPQNQVSFNGGGFYGGRSPQVPSQYRGGRQRGGGVTGGSLRPSNNNHGALNGGSHPPLVSPPSKFKPVLEQVMGQLEFKTSPIGKKHISTVVLSNGRRFQTYPHEYPTPEMAEDAACEVALRQLNLSLPGSAAGLAGRENGGPALEAITSSVPKASVSASAKSDWDNFSITESLNQQILALLNGRTNGVWSTQIDVEYEEKYKKVLPPDWRQLLEKYIENHSECPLRVDSPISNRYIILPNLNREATNSNPSPISNGSHVEPKIISTQSPPSSTTNGLPANSASTSSSPPVSPPANRPHNEDRPQQQPPKIKLPVDQYWDVYITNVNSTVNVFLRLLGKDYSEMFDSLVTDMELYYYNDMVIPKVLKPEIGRLYVANVDGDLHRVEVCGIQGIYVTCFYIDFGGSEVILIEALRELAPQFLELPAQAISVQLYGLEHLAENSSASVEVANTLQTKSLVGQVVDPGREGPISLILHDTSADQDVNLNKELSTRFNDEPPELDLSSGPSSLGTGSGLGDHLLPADLASLKELVQADVPGVGQYFDISVSMAANPNYFVVQPWRQGNDLQQLQADINVFYENAKNRRPVTGEDLKQDKYFVALHSDKCWYRIRINSMLDEETAAVRYVDYGDVSMVNIQNLQVLCSKFRNLPMQAVSAKLADIAPKNGDWSTGDSLWFSERVVNKQFVSVIKELSLKEDEGLIEISVSLVDTTHPTDDIFIEKELIESGRAVARI